MDHLADVVCQPVESSDEHHAERDRDIPVAGALTCPPATIGTTIDERTIDQVEDELFDEQRRPAGSLDETVDELVTDLAPEHHPRQLGDTSAIEGAEHDPSFIGRLAGRSA